MRVAENEKTLIDYPHAEVHSTVLADWLEQLGPDRWWNVDADYLMNRLYTPAPASKLVAELRMLDRPLLVARPDKPVVVEGPILSPEGLEPFVQRVRRYSHPDVWSERLLYLRWADIPSDWLLVEDSATTEGEARDAAEEAEGE